MAPMAPYWELKKAQRKSLGNPNLDGIGKGMCIAAVSLFLFVAFMFVACKPTPAAAPGSPSISTEQYTEVEKTKINRENPIVLETKTIYIIHVQEPDGTKRVYHNVKDWKFYDSGYIKFMLMDDPAGDVELRGAEEPLRYPSHAFLKMEQYEAKKIKYYKKVEHKTYRYKQEIEWVYPGKPEAKKEVNPVNPVIYQSRWCKELPDEADTPLKKYYDMGWWQIIGKEDGNPWNCLVVTNGKVTAKIYPIEHLEKSLGAGSWSCSSEDYEQWIAWAKKLKISDFVDPNQPFVSLSGNCNLL
jgi:hypothetical protein